MNKQREDFGFGVDVVHRQGRRLEGMSRYLADSPGSSDDDVAVGEAVIVNTGAQPVNVVLSVGISAPRLSPFLTTNCAIRVSDSPSTS
jgi:hypothetical protein